MPAIDEGFEDRCHDRLLAAKLLSILSVRNRQATLLWMAGRTYKEIGAAIGSISRRTQRITSEPGVSVERARQIVAGSVRRMRTQAQKWRLASYRNERTPDGAGACSRIEPSPSRSRAQLFVYDPVRKMSDRYVCTAYNGVPDEKWKLMGSRKVKVSKLAKLRASRHRVSSHRACDESL